jgi:hypothetical protein
MQAIRRAVSEGKPKERFRGCNINEAPGIGWGGNFLVKHCASTGSSTARFVRLSRGLYKLKDLN